MKMLACDLGGTNLRLELWDGDRCVRKRKEPSTALHSIEEALERFLRPSDAVESAVFSVAGPVLQNKARITNLHFTVDAAALKARFGWAHVALLNDLCAHAYGVVRKGASPLVPIFGRSAPKVQRGPVLLVVPGTGFGAVVLRHLENGGDTLACATESGHADLPAMDEEVVALSTYFSETHVPPTRESALAASGLSRLKAFVASRHHTNMHSASIPSASPKLSSVKARKTSDANAEIIARRNDDPDAHDAVALYVRLFARELGNLVLSTGATGGVILGGAVPNALHQELRAPAFRKSFCAHPPMDALLRTVPLALTDERDLALTGCREYAWMSFFSRLPAR